MYIYILGQGSDPMTPSSPRMGKVVMEVGISE